MIGLLLWVGVIWRIQPSWATNPSTRWLVLGLLVFLPLFGAAAIGFWRYPGQLEISLEADRLLGTGDLLTSSLCFANRRGSGIWERAVLDRAREIAEGLDPVRLVVIGVRPRLVGLIGIALVSGSCVSRLTPARSGSDTRTIASSVSAPIAVEPSAVDTRGIRAILATLPSDLTHTDIGAEVETLQLLVNEFDEGRRDLRGFDEGLASIAARLDPVLPSITPEFDDFARMLTSHLPMSQLGKALSEGRFKDAQLALQALERRWQEPRTPLTREQLESLRTAVEADRKRRLERSNAEAIERMRLQSVQDSLEDGGSHAANRSKIGELSRQLEHLDQRHVAKARAATAISAIDHALVQAASALMKDLRSQAPFEGFEAARTELERIDQMVQTDAQKRELLRRIERLRAQLAQAGAATRVAGLRRFEGRARGEAPKPGGPTRPPQPATSSSASSDLLAVESLPIPWIEQTTDGAGRPLGAAGNEHVPEIRGDASRPKMEPRRDTLAAAKARSDGSVSAEVVAAASVRGFAEPGYAQVFRAYMPVAEALLDQERLPQQSRGQVRRYFELIRPR